MAQDFLTADQITNAALPILHQKLNFIGSINRQYDDSFGAEGAKIGGTLRIRNPNQYVVRTGLNMSAGNIEETKQDLTVATVKGVDMQFGSVELALDIQDFAKRILEPAMTVLAANIEADALSMYKDVYNVSDEDATAATLLTLLKGRKILNDNLAPQARRRALLSTTHAMKIGDAIKGLFHSGDSVSKQYTEGMLGRTAGFDIYENTLMNDHTTGTAVATTTYTTNGGGTTNGSAAVTLQSATTTWLVGDVFTVADCYRVHPETKVSTGELQKFVCLANCTTAMTFSPATYVSGPRQNVTAAGMGATKAVVKVGVSTVASAVMSGSMVYHPDAFTFVTADLPLPVGKDASRKVMDGISMSYVRDFNISDRSFPARLDVLYGYKTLIPSWACRLHADG